MEELILNAQRNVRLSVYLQTHIPSDSFRPAIIVLPGGGYMNLSYHEAETIAWHYLSAGYHAFVLRYSIGEHRAWPNPLEDFEQAMALIRSRSEEWKILPDKIAVVGFSAGGHLAGCAATTAKNKPNAAILGYAPAEKTLVQMLMPEGSETIGPVEHVDKNTCPCFLFTARDDALVTVDNTIALEAALSRCGIAFESHIYAYGGHGFGDGVHPARPSGKLCSRAPRWVSDSIGWLEDVFGALTDTGVAQPACPLKLNGNADPSLSLDCTLDYLKSHPDALDILKDYLAKLDQGLIARFGEKESFHIMYGNTKLSEIMEMVGTPQQIMDTLNHQLNQIPN